MAARETFISDVLKIEMNALMKARFVGLIEAMVTLDKQMTCIKIAEARANGKKPIQIICVNPMPLETIGTCLLVIEPGERIEVLLSKHIICSEGSVSGFLDEIKSQLSTAKIPVNTFATLRPKSSEDKHPEYIVDIYRLPA